MLQKTRGIVFRFTKFRDTSIIVNIFTELYGLQSYIVNGVRTSTAKNKMALYQPLTLLDLVIYHKENANINRIKEVKTLYPYQSLQSDFRKSAIAMFINEVLNKAVKEESHAQETFDFLFESMMVLDKLKDCENFHLVFLIKLSRYLGFGAHDTNEINSAGQLSAAEEKILGQLLTARYMDEISMTNQERRTILESLLRFYSTHIETFGEMKSINVLREIMS